MDTSLLVKALGGLFAIMNPFVALPIFLSLTAGYDVARQRRTALRTALYSLVVGLVVLVAGHAILAFFGVDVDHFRIAGGLVLLLIALGMLNGTGSTTHEGTAQEKQQHAQQAQRGDVSFYPLAFPMLVGPGTITTLVALTGDADGFSEEIAVGVALLVVVATLAVVLWLAPTIGHHLSGTLRTIMTRLMGMILAAIAVEMVVVGLGDVFPALRG